MYVTIVNLAASTSTEKIDEERWPVMIAAACGIQYTIIIEMAHNDRLR